MCAPKDQAPAATFRSRSWNEGTLVGGRYTCASDLYHLGAMLREHDRGVTSRQGADFLARITQPAKEQQDSAEDLLRHPWLRCESEHCRAAGAQQGDLWA